MMFILLAATRTVDAGVLMRATPVNPLMDTRITFALSGLEANIQVKLSAKSQAQDGLWWRSEAVYRTDANGRIDLDRQAPLQGTYRGIDPMGLFWSMRPDDAPSSADHLSYAVADYSRPIATTIEARDSRGPLAAIPVIRSFAPPSILDIPIRGDIRGTLYRPKGDIRRPAVLVIGGSDGGPGEPGLAMLLASRGFAALSLSYFGEPGLPNTLENIPMEYFRKAVTWMCRQPGVDPRFIAIYAESRGTEPGLYTAAFDPRIKAVIARSPSFALWEGVSAHHLPGGAAWTLRGHALPYIANTLYPDFFAAFLWDRLTGAPVRQTPLFLEDLAHGTDAWRAAIPVEKIRGPVMLLAGEDDQIWPSAMMADRIMARLRRNAHVYHDEELKYAGVGHPIPFAYLPTNGRREDASFAIGGTAEGTAKAQAEAWQKMLQFLSDAVARHH